MNDELPDFPRVMTFDDFLKTLTAWSEAGGGVRELFESFPTVYEWMTEEGMHFY